jgi:hypothetical protein
MAATKKAEISGLGFDPQFGQLDTRGLPGFDDAPEQSWTDDRFGGMVNEHSYRLRDELSKMVEEDGRDPEVAAVLKEAGIDNPAMPTTIHVSGKPFTIAFKDGLWRGEGVLNRARIRLTGKDRDELLGKFMALARKNQRESIQKLSESQLTEVARIAQRDRVQAVNAYLSYAFPDNYGDDHDADKIVSDPRHTAFLSQVCEFVWLNSRLDATDSEDWQDFKAQFIGQRPVSCALLDHAWEEFSNKRNRLVFAEPPMWTWTASAMNR